MRIHGTVVKISDFLHFLLTENEKDLHDITRRVEVQRSLEMSAEKNKVLVAGKREIS